MRVPVLLAVDHLHQQRPLDVKSRHLIEGRGRKEDLGVIVQLGAVGARSHDHGVASVIFVEALDIGTAHAPGCMKHMLRVGRVEPVAWVELVVFKLAGVEMGQIPS